MLLKPGADKDKAMTTDGATPLFIAAQKGHHEVVEMLLKAGADKDKATSDIGDTPLNVAAEWGHDTVVEILIRAGADTDKATTDTGCTSLYAAAWAGHDKVVEMLLKAGADKDKAKTTNGATPLIIAAENGHDKVVERLLKAGASINIVLTTNSYTPLTCASLGGKQSITAKLLAAGADPALMSTAQYNEHPVGSTALSIAASKGHDKIVAGLLRAHPANASQADSSGTAPALHAARKGHRETLLHLLQANACPIAPDTTVLHEAARLGNTGMVDDIVTVYPTSKRWYAFLMSAGTATKRAVNLPPAHRSSAGKLYKKDVLRHIHSLLHKPRYLADLNTRDSNGETAAQIAQRLGHQAIVKLLKDNGATVHNGAASASI